MVYGVLLALLVATAIRLCDSVLTPLVFYRAGSAVCWPTDGILLAVVLMARRRDWPWIAAGFVLDQFVAATWPLQGIVIDSVCNLFEVFTAAYFLPPFRTMSEWLRQPRLIVRFTSIAVLLSPLGAALVGSIYFRHLHPPNNYIQAVLAWESSDALGIALWTPLVLSLFSLETYSIFRRGRLARTLLVLTLMPIGSWFIFNQNLYPIAFLLFPMLVVVVYLLGFPGAVFCLNAVTIIAASATIRGHGPFIFIQGSHESYRIMTLQIYLILAMLMSFTISLTTLEREAFEEKLQLALKQMEMLATHDALTGLGNRRLFDVTLDVEWRRAQRDRTCIALLLLDADEFKRYNDIYGHLLGDVCLQEIAKTLASAWRRSGDLVARYGGEEFVVLLPRTTREQVVAEAEKICLLVNSLQMQHKGNEHGCVTVSVGCAAVIPAHRTSPEVLIRAADSALYAAKERGRNCVAFHETDALGDSD